MAYGIVRMQKYHYDDIKGIESHIERTATKSNTNPDIQKGKSKNNYDLTGLKDFTLKSLINKRLKELNIKRAKNSVVMCELMFTASPELFENMTDCEIKSYFQKCLDFAKKQYGEENIIAAEIHLDEKTPHMHLELVPIKDNKLNAKNIFDKFGLKKLQDKAHEQIFSQYGLERGDTEKHAKHKATEELKRDTLKLEVDSLIEKKNALQEEITELEKARNTDALYQARNHLKVISEHLNELMSTIEHDPELLKHYKLVAQELKAREQEQERGAR